VHYRKETIAAMASAVPDEESPIPITSVKIETRLADDWICYQELFGDVSLSGVARNL